MNVTYENEQFLLHNDLDSGIFLFSTKINLTFQISKTTITVFKNRNFIFIFKIF